MSIASKFPSINPTLLLDFANVGRLDPRITFTRASTATYYNGVTTAKAEQNLLLQSQDFTTTWGTTNVVNTADTTTAPDGTNTADTITENLVTGNHQTTQSVVFGSSNAYTFSLYVQANGCNTLTVLFRLGGAGAVSAQFDYDLTVPSATVNSGTSASATITDVGGGWFRITGTSSSNQASTLVILRLTRLGASYAGDGTSGMYFWGAQLEQRSAVTAYTPTTTQPITNYIPVLQTAAAGVARFDHNPTTDESLGLLIEEQRTNLFTYSADFSNAAWVKTRSSIDSNIIIAPDGTLTGDKLVEDTTASNSHFTSQDVSFTSGTTYTYSIYAKDAGRRYLQLILVATAFTSNLIAVFDLSAGTSTQSSGSTTITPVGNGWYRCTFTAAATVTATAGIQVRLSSSYITTASSYTGNGYSGLFIWGAQLEAGAFPTSYIATTTTALTRNADAVSMTGTNFSSWYNAAEGTLFAQFLRTATVNSQLGRVFSLSNASNTASIELYQSGGNDPAAQIINTTIQGQWTTTGYTVGIPVRQALAYQLNNSNTAYNGTAQTPDTVCTIPTVTQANIGNRQDGVRNLNGWIQRLSYYPTRFPDSTLQALTA